MTGRMGAAARAAAAALILCRVNAAAADSPAPSAEADNAASARYRPAYHFSPARNWMNDPKMGLPQIDGAYHLFFQYNPFGNRWGHMSWGHARSADLVHWQELPVATK